MTRVEAVAGTRAAAIRTRLTDRLRSELPDLSIGEEGEHVVIAGRGLSLRRINDARLRGLGMLARGFGR